MKNEQLSQLLDIHAEGLKEDNDLSIYLIQDWLEDESYSEAMMLLRLAKALKNALRPLKAPPRVTTLVYADMYQDSDSQSQHEVEPDKRWILLGAIAGVAGLLYWLHARENENISTAV